MEMVTSPRCVCLCVLCIRHWSKPSNWLQLLLAGLVSFAIPSKDTACLSPDTETTMVGMPITNNICPHALAPVVMFSEHVQGSS